MNRNKILMLVGIATLGAIGLVAFRLYKTSQENKQNRT